MTEASSSFASLSAVFPQTTGANTATNFFSDLVKSKFARKHKPEEFNITSTVKEDGDDDVNDDDGSVNPADDIRTLRNNEKKRKRYENFCKYYDLKIKSREIAAGELYYK